MSDRGSPAPDSPQITPTLVDVSERRVESGSDAYKKLWSSWVEINDNAEKSVLFSEDVARCKHATFQFTKTYGPISTHSQGTADGRLPANFLFIPSMYGAYGSPEHLEAMLQYWLELGLDVNSRAVLGMTPLIYAAGRFTGRLSTYMSLLIQHGANVHAVDADGRTALHLVLHMLCLHHSSSPDQETPREAEAQLVVLLEAGCDPNARCRLGKTPSQYVSRGGKAWETWVAALDGTRGRRMMLGPGVLWKVNRY